MSLGFALNRHVLRTSCRSAVLAVAVLSLSPAARAAGYDEAVSGDLSSDAKNPTDIGSLVLGNNAIVGSTVPSGAVIDPMTGARAVEDDDYVSFTVPTGFVLSRIDLGGGSVFQQGDRMFLGIAQGGQVDVDPGFSSASGLLGWTLVGGSMVGSDLLPALGSAAPANFPPIGGATKFTGALGAGVYTLWMVDGDRPAAYDLELVTSAVPDAASWIMMTAGLGMVGASLRRRRTAATRFALA